MQSNNFSCELCPRLCKVDRIHHLGKCHSYHSMRVCRIAPHHYEEPPISGTQGSGTIFFSGCSLDCEFCQNYKISKQPVGKTYSPFELSEEIKKLESLGVHNVNFVTPTHFSDLIIETLDIYRPSIPIVYNTSGYELPRIIEKLNNYVDVYLVDMKYSDNEIAKKFSNVNNYVDFCKNSIEVMVKNKPLLYDENGLLKQGVIIRHLVLPDNLKNTYGVIDFFADNYKDKALFSVMSQFVPMYNSSITRTLKPIEYKLVTNYILKRDIEDCFIQELSSAVDTYTPDFDTNF